MEGEKLHKATYFEMQRAGITLLKQAVAWILASSIVSSSKMFRSIFNEMYIKPTSYPLTIGKLNVINDRILAVKDIAVPSFAEHAQALVVK